MERLPKFDAWRLDTPPYLEDPEHEPEGDMDTVYLMESFEVTVPGHGKPCVGLLFQTTSRKSGRRIKVCEGGPEAGQITLDAMSNPIFDTNDQYDLGNATNCLDQWLQSRLDAEATDKPGLDPTLAGHYHREMLNSDSAPVG